MTLIGTPAPFSHKYASNDCKKKFNTILPTYIQTKYLYNSIYVTEYE